MSDPFYDEAEDIVSTVEDRAGKKFPAAVRAGAVGIVAEILSRAWEDGMDTAREKLEEAVPEASQEKPS